MSNKETTQKKQSMEEFVKTYFPQYAPIVVTDKTLSTPTGLPELKELTRDDVMEIHRKTIGDPPIWPYPFSKSNFDSYQFVCKWYSYNKEAIFCGLRISYYIDNYMDNYKVFPIIEKCIKNDLQATLKIAKDTTTPTIGSLPSYICKKKDTE